MSDKDVNMITWWSAVMELISANKGADLTESELFHQRGNTKQDGSTRDLLLEEWVGFFFQNAVMKSSKENKMAVCW